MDDMLMWKMFTGVLIFAAGNVLYFEIRRIIHFLQIYFKESQPLEDHLQASDFGTGTAHVQK